MSEIYQITVISTIAAFIILFLGKTGWRNRIRDYYDKVGIGIIADMLDCDFCLSFWTCFILILLITALTGDKSWYIAVFCAPPITRVLL